MRRAALLFGAGLLVGGLAIYLLGGEQADLTGGTSAAIAAADSQASRSATASPRAMDFLELVTGSVDSTERAALYRLAAEADRATLEGLLTQVAALPKIASRAEALELLLLRYGEIDAAAAAALARKLALEAAVVAPLFASWARRDAGAALRALGDMQNNATALSVGIALLQVFGNDDLGIIRVLGAAPQINADRFRIEAAIAKTATDPEAAVADALLLPASKRQTAVAGIATAWAKSDPHGALAHVEDIDDVELRNAFKASALQAWVTIDPEAMLAYLVDLSPEEQNAAIRLGAVQTSLAVLEPAQALEAAESLSGEFGSMLRRAALMGLARDDALAALRHAEGMQLGPERDQLMSVIAQSYGQADPTAAVAWAQSSGASGLLGQVISGIASVDPERAVDLVFTLPAADQARLMQMLAANNSLGTAQTAALADRMLVQSPRGRALQTLTNMWARRAPAEALPWLLAHPGSVAPNTIPQAGLNLARTDPAAAIGYLDRVPAELRGNWISAVAEGYAQNDPSAAASWIAQYRGQRGYDAAVAAVAAHTARQDPVAAARLLASIDLTEAPDAPASARTIAASWVKQDTQAAARWARDLDGDLSPGAVAVVASQWAARDASAARNWALSLPPNPARDAALVQIVGVTAGTTATDPALLDAFSSPAALERGISEAARIIAARDTDVARQLADRYVTDPGLRQATERFIEQGSGGPVLGPPAPRVPSAR